MFAKETSRKQEEGQEVWTDTRRDSGAFQPERYLLPRGNGMAYSIKYVEGFLAD